MKFNTIAWVVGACLAAAASVQAQITTLDYTGLVTSGTSQSLPTGLGYMMTLPKTGFTGEYTAQITLEGSASNDSLQMLSFSVDFIGTGASKGFSVGVNALPFPLENYGGLDFQPQDPSLGNDYIDVLTAKNGSIDGARLNLDIQVANEPEVDFRIGSYGDKFGYTYGSPLGTCDDLRDEGGPKTNYSGGAISPCSIASRNKVTGSWTVSNSAGVSKATPANVERRAVAPEIDVASMGGAMTLLLGGLAVVRGRRRS
jgi:hypothetical protein